MLFGFVVGSLVRPVQAQLNVDPPFQVAQRVSLSYGEPTIDCTVQEIRGTFLLCAPAKPDPFMKFPAYATLHNIASTENISIVTSSR